ncbi:hypothetical protein QR98_0053440 [Sarcoptes scabiei]|uniref:Uncharacterized protein n=1 Tax=Sarcoptes scabiei TaxID=52283 RepID=A0A132A7E9_SARSC|nr:hypothetical protein QR98_0053440 [Sarcoptes scabiei]
MDVDQVAVFKTQNLQGIATLCTLNLELESGLVDVDGAAQSLRNITIQANRNLDILLGMELDAEEKTGLILTHLGNRKEASNCITEIRRMIQEKEKCRFLPLGKEMSETSEFCKESYDDLRAVEQRLMEVHVSQCEVFSSKGGDVRTSKPNRLRVRGFEIEFLQGSRFRGNQVFIA